jgi:transcriptional regulator with XRE-family HTH domain
MKSHKEFKSTLSLLGETIYQQRILKNLVTKEIAAELSLTPEAYRNIEKGESDPSFTTLLRITQVLKIDFFELMKFLELKLIEDSSINNGIKPRVFNPGRFAGSHKVVK